MRLGIISDTHDQLERTQRAIAALLEAGATHFCHCGDFCCGEILELFAPHPTWYVYGNNDDYIIPRLMEKSAEYPNLISLQWGGIFELAGKRIGVTHGHLLKEVNALLQAKPDFLLSGHSHIANRWEQDSVQRINPGAIFRAHPFTAAVLDLESGISEQIVVK